MHWINFPLLAMMVWSGLLIYWANAVYSVRLGGYELFHFFPQWFWDTRAIPFRLKEGLKFLFFFMWLSTLTGLAYSTHPFVSGGWLPLLPFPGSLKRAPPVALHAPPFLKKTPPQGK